MWSCGFLVDVVKRHEIGIVFVLGLATLALEVQEVYFGLRGRIV